ncbi:MAG: hypothetical protein MCM46_01000 [Candidatus Manganitrophus sp. SB1]|nr:hypothetical protein [Candidatus Manganitrophus morganii]
MMLAKDSTSDSISIPAVLIAATALIFPFVNIIYIIYPITFLGKNVWLVAPVLVIMALYLSTLFDVRKGFTVKKTDIIFLAIVIAGGLIFYLRELVYVERRSFLDYRYILAPTIFLLVSKRFVNGDKNINFLSSALVLTCFIQAILGILHASFFPELNISFDPDNVKNVEFVFDAERTREGGTLGASIYANVIVCGMFLLATKRPTPTSLRSSILLTISIMVMLYAVTLSGSRYPIVIAGLLTLTFFINSLSNWRQWVAIGMLAIFSIIWFTNMENVEFYSIFRFSEDSGGRIDKLILPFELLIADMFHLLVGASNELTANTYSSSGVGISDNSYWLLSLQFGPIFALFWFGFVVNLLMRDIVNNASFFFLVYFLIGLGITNCILWEPWVFLAIFTGTILHRRDQIGGEIYDKYYPHSELRWRLENSTEPIN